jgi:hypothetical protein
MATNLGAWLAEIAAYAALVGGVLMILLVGLLVWIFFGFAIEHDEWAADRPGSG